MAECQQKYHVGRRDVRRLLYVHKDGVLIEGCVQCVEQYTHNMYPTQKQTRILPDGKSFQISPAHVRDIRQRRSAPDLSGTWRDKKGLGSNMRY